MGFVLPCQQHSGTEQRLPANHRDLDGTYFIFYLSGFQLHESSQNKDAVPYPEC